MLYYTGFDDYKFTNYDFRKKHLELSRNVELSENNTCQRGELQGVLLTFMFLVECIVGELIVRPISLLTLSLLTFSLTQTLIYHGPGNSTPGLDHGPGNSTPKI